MNVRVLLAVFRVGLADAMEYRGNLITRVVFGYVGVAVAFLLWREIFRTASGAEIGGWTFPEMVTYYLAAHCAYTLSDSQRLEWGMSQEIRDGDIKGVAMRPIPPIGYRAMLLLAQKVVTAAILVPATLVAVVILSGSLASPPGWRSILMSVPAVVGAAVVAGLLGFLAATVAFWVTEVWALLIVKAMIQRFVEGEMLPLDLLPAWLQAALHWTPFPYLVYFPARVFLGRATPGEVAEGLAIQAAWALVLWGLAHAAWRRGLRDYGAWGG